MAVKFFGECSGASGSKYNIWLELCENSQNITDNSSNITVKLKLKRNDGYSDSAYNLNESDNSASITVAGVRRTNINLKIDTRNSSTVTLSQWTGNVKHNSDGSLKLSVAGSFSMSGTSLSGGSVNGQFTCVTIPRSSSFSVSKTSFNPLETVTVNITPASNTFTHELLWEIGDYKEAISLLLGVTTSSFTIPIDWANAIPNSKRGLVRLTLKTFNNGKPIGNVVKTLTMVLPDTDDFLPDFNIKITDNKNGIVPGNWANMVQNKSTITVSPVAEKFKYGASKQSDFAVVLSQKKSGLPCEFDLTSAGIIDVTVRVTDSRGFFREKTVVTRVDEYFNPTIFCDTLFRCDQNGSPLNTGTRVYGAINRNYASIGGLNYTVAKLKFRKNNETAYSEPVTISGNTFLLEGPFDITSSYEFLFSITDAITKTEFQISRSLSSSNIPFNIKKGGKGVAFGCYCENENELTVAYDMNVMGKIKYNSLNNSVALNSVATLNSKNIKKYDCLDLITLNASVRLNSNIGANLWTEVFKINNAGLNMSYPLSIFSQNQSGAKIMFAFIDSSGSVKINSSSGFTQGETIILNSMIF